MTSNALPLIEELDPKKKDYEWANHCLTALRTQWRPMKNVMQGLENRAIMYSMQELNDVKESFDDEDFKKRIKFYPVPVLEPLVNSMVEDITKQPPKAELRAEDPTAITEKKEDLQRLEGRFILERDRSELQSRVGFGKYKVPYDKFNGNVEEFDKMGLDDRDPDDVNFYEHNFQRLWYEIGGQSLINNVMKTNQFDKSTIRKLVKDVFWAKCVSTQCYVDQMTGEIKYKYIDPQIARGIFGQSNDGKDDICRGWEDSITLQEFMAMIGNEFDWNKCWKHLLWGINFCNNRRFTGFIRGGVTYDCCHQDASWMEKMGCADIQTSELLDWTMAYQFKIFTGYVEWRTIEATSTKLINKNEPDYFDYVPYSYELKKKQKKEGYDKESYYQQQWYRSYYLATSGASQYVYGFQKLYYQHIHGANDEYSNGTLAYYQEEGKSAVEISKAYLQPFNFIYYRLLWILYKSKPDADEFVWEELTQLAGTIQRQFPQTATNKAPALDTIINDLIKNMRAKHVRIRTYPRIDGKPVPQIYPIEKQGSGGVDPIAITFQAILMWIESQIAAKIGINPMRIGADPPPRESTTSEKMTLQASYATTGYMYRMIQYLKEHLAITTLNYATDILQYKDSLPYKWLLTVMGNESFEALKSLGKFAAHRYGIYIDDYNNEIDKQRLFNAADIALTQKTITLGQWAIVTQTMNPKLGFKILAHLELKAKKRERRQAVQDMAIQDKMAQKEHERRMAELIYDRQTKWGVADRDYKKIVTAAQISAEAKVEVKERQIQNEIPKVQAKTEGDKEVRQTESNLKQQEALP